MGRREGLFGFLLRWRENTILYTDRSDAVWSKKLIFFFRRGRDYMSLGRHEGWDIADKQTRVATSSLVMGENAVARYSDTGRQEDKEVEAVEGRTTLREGRRKKVLEVWGEIRTCEIALRESG